MENKHDADSINQTLVRLLEFTNVCLVISCALRELIKDLIKQHKEANIIIKDPERRAWRQILNGTDTLDQIAFETGSDNYKKFKASIKIVKFILLELIAKCDDSDIRLWQFHNLLKSYPTVYKSIQPTLDEEVDAFTALFNQNKLQPEQTNSNSSNLSNSGLTDEKRIKK